MAEAAVFAPAARRDLAAAVAWIARENPRAAGALRDAAVQAARRIGTHPGLGAGRPFLGAERYRFLPLRGFSYLLVYVADTAPPRILRVLHMARDMPTALSPES